MDLAYLVHSFLGLLGIILFGLTYTFIDKMEKTGCACAEHKYRKFLRTYSVVAFIFLALQVVFPPAAAMKAFGPLVSNVYTFGFVLPFYLTSFVFFILALIYIEYLMKEKCKCSEDVRREIIYYWSIAKIIIIGMMFVLPLMFFVSASLVGVVSGTVDFAKKQVPRMHDTLVDPLRAAGKVGKMVKGKLRK